MAAVKPAAITGRGIVSPLGAGVELTFQHMCEGRVATGPEESIVSLRPGQHVGTVDMTTLTTPQSHRGVRRLDRTVMLVVEAVTEALTEADLLPTSSRRLPDNRIALCLGTSTGPITVSAGAAVAFGQQGEAGLKRVAPLAAVHASPAFITGEVCRRFEVTGPSMTLNAECASGNTVVAIGMHLLSSGAADAVVCCAVDASVNELTVAQSNIIGALAAGQCRPFDRDRDGFVISEGAAAVVLEPVGRETCPPDAPTPAVHVLGVGMTTDTFHPTAPAESGASLVEAVKAALTQAELPPAAVDVVSAHGTGTPMNDRSELEALEEVFGGDLARIPVHSVKSMIGHTLAAAGLIELIVLSHSLETGLLPPTMGCRTPLETSADLVLHACRQGSFTTGLSTSIGFGGNNTAAVLGLACSLTRRKALT